MLSSSQIRQKYLDFFAGKDHIIIPSAPLIPENDPTALFTTAGMHPLVPFLLGAKHPAGRRLASVQKCIRTVDIDEVGDNTHLTFFEMLGNWSLGDYFKQDSISYSWEFLTSSDWIGLDKSKLAITVFGADNRYPDLKPDHEAHQIWQDIGVSPDRIAYLPGGVKESKNNWWGPAGETGPCGPDTEIFYWTATDIPAPDKFDPADERWVEIWNNVFMQFNKTKDGQFVELEQKNVDTGLGFERLVMILQNQASVYDTDLFKPLQIKLQSLLSPDSLNSIKTQRIILDHFRTSLFMLSEKIVPSNQDQGYVLRRLIRSTIRHLRELHLTDYQSVFHTLINEIYDNPALLYYSQNYPQITNNKEFIIKELDQEIIRFEKVLEHGIKEFEKFSIQIKQNSNPILSGRLAFKLYDTYGFPIEITKELAAEEKITVDEDGFKDAFAKHQEKSRLAGEQRFKGGLADNSEITTSYHTITHLLHAALRQTLGTHVEQRGSNITAERLRFDFSHPHRLTPEQLTTVENWVNNALQNNLIIEKTEMSLEDALAQGSIGLFKDKYGEKVSVYKIFDQNTGQIYSMEICGGPHITSTKELGHFKILKEESSSSGIRRIKAILEK
jgi:alanyl-tRNA synthetase